MERLFSQSIKSHNQSINQYLFESGKTPYTQTLSFIIQYRTTKQT